MKGAHMKNLVFGVALTLLFFSRVSLAEDLVPATSDDQSKFDQQVSDIQAPPADSGTTSDSDGKEKKENLKKQHVKKEKKANFGMIVSAEAKKLKDLPKDQKKEMGKWVSDQRRKNLENGGNTSAGHGDSSAGGGASSANDGRASAPSAGNTANPGSSTNAPGKSGDHRK